MDMHPSEREANDTRVVQQWWEDTKNSSFVDLPSYAGEHESHALPFGRCWLGFQMFLFHLVSKKTRLKYDVNPEGNNQKKSRVAWHTSMMIFSISLSQITSGVRTTELAFTSRPPKAKPMKPYSLSPSTTSGCTTASTNPPAIATLGLILFSNITLLLLCFPIDEDWTYLSWKNLNRDSRHLDSL